MALCIDPAILLSARIDHLNTIDPESSRICQQVLDELSSLRLVNSAPDLSCDSSPNITTDLVDHDNTSTSDFRCRVPSRASVMNPDEDIPDQVSDASDFKFPPLRKTAAAKRKQKLTEPSIISTNKFACLQREPEPNDNCVDMEAGTPLPASSNSGSKFNKTERIPPITVKGIENWPGKEKEFQAILKDKFTVRDRGALGLKIQVNNVNDFRKLQDKLDTDGFEFFTHLLPSEKPLKFVIRGLPMSIPSEDIAEAIRTEGFSTATVSRLRKNNKELMPLVLVQVSKNDCIKRKLYDLRVLLSCIISVEKFRRGKGATQCFRCQKFHHGAKACHNTPICVKCAGEHHSYQCVKKFWGEEAKCCLCEGNHSANYHGCPMNPRNIVKKASKPSQRTYQHQSPNRSNLPGMTSQSASRNVPTAQHHTKLTQAPVVSSNLTFSEVVSGKRSKQTTSLPTTLPPSGGKQVQSSAPADGNKGLKFQQIFTTLLKFAGKLGAAYEQGNIHDATFLILEVTQQLIDSQGHE